MGDKMPDTHRFRGTIRYWRPERAAGLVVVDIPADIATALGGLKQMRVRGVLGGVAYASSTMPAGGGRLALSVSRKMLDAAGLSVGDEGDFEIEKAEAPA
jgi:hypothetical protein